MKTEELRLIARRPGLAEDPLLETVTLFLYVHDFDRRVQQVANLAPADLTWVSIEQGEQVPVRGLNVTIHAAQNLMDHLWDCGLRPTQGKGSAGQLEATEKHLEDMRRLVFAGTGRP